jgi:hypothetical protein
MFQLCTDIIGAQVEKQVIALGGRIASIGSISADSEAGSGKD